MPRRKTNPKKRKPKTLHVLKRKKSKKALPTKRKRNIIKFKKTKSKRTAKPKAAVAPKLDRRQICAYETKGFKEGKMLGKGASGMVVQLCDEKNNCPYVLKVVNMKTAQQVKQFELEVDYQRRASQIGVAPDVFDAWTCRTPEGYYKGFLATEFLEGSLPQYLNLFAIDSYDRVFDELVAQIKQLADQLHAIGIEHGDLHEHNIRYKLINGEAKFYLIDFGLSGPVGHPRRLGRKDNQELARLRKHLENILFLVRL